jgi:hypothetical protein
MRSATLGLALALVTSASASAVQGAARSAVQPQESPGTADLSIRGDGEKVAVELSAPAITLLGFDHSPRGAEERATLELAKENLQTGDALIRFNTRAGCRLASATVNAQLAPSHSGRQPSMSASYRFECDQPEQLESAAVGLFVGFPALERVLVRYALPQRKGGTVLTRARLVVSFVPMDF